MENVSEIFWVTATENMRHHESASRGIWGFIYYPAVALYRTPASCYPCCFLSHTQLLFELSAVNTLICCLKICVTQLLYGTSNKSGTIAGLDTYTCFQHESNQNIIYLKSRLGSQVRITLMINNLLSACSVVIVYSAFEPLLTMRWTNRGRVNRIRWYFCHGRPPLISLHLPNKSWHHSCLQHTFLWVKNETCSFAF